MQAVVYIKVAQHEEEEEVPVTIETAEGEKKKEGDEEKEVETKIVKRMVDEDQQGKVLAVQGTEIAGLENKPLFSINQYASKAYRESILEFIISLYPEFFDENNEQDEIMSATDNRAETDVRKYILANCQKYERPCLEFKFNAVELG